MTVEMTTDEAEILIAILEFAEGAAHVLSPPLVEAIAVLRPFRSALLRTWLAARLAVVVVPEPADAELTADAAAQALGAFVAQKDAAFHPADKDEAI